MKKIGLLSFPRYFNYGTQLQLYALQTVIEKLGYDCEVIDYERRFWTSHYSIERGIRKIRRLGGVFCDPLKILRNRPIKAYYRKYDHLTEERTLRFNVFLHSKIRLGPRRYFSYYELCSDPPTGDAFVCGSDQIWNPIFHSKDASYYLDFVPKEKRIAYAASIGAPFIPEKVKTWMAKAISDIPAVSIREQRGAELVKELTGRDVPVVVDPTLLLSKEEWTAMVSPPIHKKPYIVCYILEADLYIRDHARALAQKYGFDLVIIQMNRVDVENNDVNIVKVFNAGPYEFVSLIKNAEFVIADSFHGTVFSIIFQRPFFSFRRYLNYKDAITFTRIESLLDLLGLSDRIMDKERDLPDDPMRIDFSNASVKLEQMKQSSLNFLRNSLSQGVES